MLGAIALIVIAAINPIEQANRSRDTRLKADSSQMVSASERYFVSVGEFPWVTAGSVSDSTKAFGYVNAADPGIGICGDASCTADGVLITTEELKDEFMNRDFIKKATDPAKALMIGKENGSSSSVYACYIPLAKATRERSLADEQVYSVNTSDGSRSSASCTDSNDDWISLGCYVCVPE